MHGPRLRLLATSLLLAAGGVYLAAGGPLPSVGGAGRASASAAADPVVAAAGDIACDPTNTSFNAGAGTASNCRQRATSDLLVGAGLRAVLPLGDNQNYCGSLAAYQQAYDPSWGRVKSISHPAVGNHEYLTSGGGTRGTLGCDASNAGAAGYFAYWGAAAGKAGQGYYSFDVGSSWHVVVLNTNCGDAGGCTPTSAQGRWLSADLAANRAPCTLASFHIPLFSSGGRAAQNAGPLWDALYAAHADVVLDGHDHIYERFAQQTPAGVADPAGGIREFIVGTGGENHTSIAAVAPNSQVRNTDTYGVLELVLHPGSYDWQFVPEAGKTFTDSGTTTCHNATSGGGDTTPPTPPTNLTATTTSPTSVRLTWSAATDDVGIADYQVRRNATQIATTTQTTYTDTTTQPATTYTYTITARDSAGNQSPPSNTTTITTPPAGDTTPPSAPTGLAATATSPTRVELRWSAAHDDVGVAGYRVLRDGSEIARTPTTDDADTRAEPSTSYRYAVIAYDAAGNESAASAAVTVTTPGGPASGPSQATSPPVTSAPASPTGNAGASVATRASGYARAVRRATLQLRLCATRTCRLRALRSFTAAQRTYARFVDADRGRPAPCGTAAGTLERRLSAAAAVAGRLQRALAAGAPSAAVGTLERRLRTTTSSARSSSSSYARACR